MDILLNFTCRRCFVDARLGLPFLLPVSAHAGAGFFAFWEDLLTMVQSGGHGDRLRSGAQSETLAPPRFGVAA